MQKRIWASCLVAALVSCAPVSEESTPTDAGRPAPNSSDGGRVEVETDASTDASTGMVDRSPEESPERAADRIELEAARSAALVSPPDVDEWRRRVIYFVLVDRFRNGAPQYDRLHGDSVCNAANDAHTYQGGDLIGLREHLDYIEELGADSIWITPLYRGVAQMAGINCGFPGYWADFAEPSEVELDPRFGTASDFDALLEDMHARDMPLMLDMVVNHAGYEARLLRQRPHWFTNPTTCAQQGNPDIYCPLAGLPDFDHRVPEVRSYLIDIHRRWLQRFDIDAIRMDTVKHVEPSYFTEWTGAMRSERPGMYMVGELLDEHDLGPFHRYLDSGFDGLFNFPLRRALIESFAHGGSVDIAASRMSETLSRFGPERAGAMVNLLDNHDVRRFVEEIPRNISGDEARRRYELALTSLLTLPGVPQIYYGNEIGMFGGNDPHNRRFMPDWAFDPEAREGSHAGFLMEPSRVFEHTQRLLRVRSRIPALQTGSYTELWRQNGGHNNNVWAYLRRDEASSVIVVHNNGLRETDGAVPIRVGAHFADGVVFTDELGAAGIAPIRVEGGILRVRLPGRSSVILSPDSTGMGETAIVRFEISANTFPGQNVYVTGDSPILGGWNLNRARPLRPSGCQGRRCSWTGQISFPIGSSVELKLVKLDPRPGAQWEQGANRRLEISGPRNVETAFRE